MRFKDLRPIERRVLAYLDQRGPTHRERIARDLSADGTKTARLMNGTNGAVPLIVGAWCARLKKLGLVQEIRARGFYQQHIITMAGSRALREMEKWR